jgi:hypothetical protein
LLLPPALPALQRVRSAAAGAAGECAALPDGTLKRAVAAVVFARGRGGAVGQAFSSGELAAVHPCVRGGGRAWSARRDVLFLVMGASFHVDRARALRATWLKGLPRTLLVGDAADEALGMVTLPELEGKEGYGDAQHRTLRGLIHAMSLPAAGLQHAEGDALSAEPGAAPAPAPWVLMVDDDTFVSVHLGCQFCALCLYTCIFPHSLTPQPHTPS